MSTPKETAQQFIAQVLRGNINRQGQSTASESIDSLLSELYPDLDPMMCCHQFIINSVESKLTDAIRDATSDIDHWMRVGQMDLFDSKEFKIPASYLSKSLDEADAFMSDKARIETEAADELAKAWNAQQDKASRIAKWAAHVHQLKLNVESAGYDPSEVSIEKAIKQAQAVRDGASVASGQASKRPVRPVRSPAGRANADRPQNPD